MLKVAIVIEEEQEQNLKKEIKYKEILEILDKSSLLSKDLFELAKFTSSYYHCSLGTVLFAMIPSSMTIEFGEEVKKVVGMNLDNLTENEKIIFSSIKR